MEGILLSAYAVLLIAQICLLVRKRWTAAFCLSLIGLAAAVVLTIVFDSLPGSGMMPGLTWFTEVISRMAAASSVNATGYLAGAQEYLNTAA